MGKCVVDVNQYVETTWSRFRQIWEVDQESFIAIYEVENTDLQRLEADIARFVSSTFVFFSFLILNFSRRFVFQLH